LKRTVLNLVKFIGERGEVLGDATRSFSNAKPIQSASPESLTFCASEGVEELRMLNETRAGVILCKFNAHLPVFEDKTMVIVKNPRLGFIRAIRVFFPKMHMTGVHQTAIVGRRCKIGKDVYIGPYVTICDGVVIGSGTQICSGVNICNPTRIGKNVTIKPGCVIGSDGFGYEKNEKGIFERFQHFGGVVIEDNVEIGANTCIDRGTLSDTVIGKGTKIDNLVHIAHNVKIGRNCVIVALSMVGGGTQIEDGVWVAPAACLRNGIVIGKGAIVGMGAVVTKNVECGETVIGVPAKPMQARRENDDTSNR